ncbi:hypothetical protein BT96DRAFT_1010939 [Gymnopus androsaceus JB14]|uniref:Uncharacterized protein n=1 Tax=Gymnopus androsaceus JB14 TaxID=1447944 RepID=A0A6A4G9Z2_9AGAR|nr:hypothetical protein BT96DRAFT_1010939 [Gymnopus androsaceus JB14]
MHLLQGPGPLSLLLVQYNIQQEDSSGSPSTFTLIPGSSSFQIPLGDESETLPIPHNTPDDFEQLPPPHIPNDFEELLAAPHSLPAAAPSEPDSYPPLKVTALGCASRLPHRFWDEPPQAAPVLMEPAVEPNAPSGIH